MLMIHDGRARTAPAYTADARSPEEFQDAYVEAIMRAIITGMPNPTPPDELPPEQARLYHGTYMKHFSFFAWRFPSWLMAVASACPYQDVRASVIGDCVDEEVGDPDVEGRCHIDVLYDEAAACGIPRDEVVTTEPSVVTFAALNALENLARVNGWLPGFAALSALEVLSSEPAVKKRAELTSQLATDEYDRNLSSKTLHEKIGAEVGDLRFFELHSYKDRFHGGGELALIVKYAHTRELQDQVLASGRAGAEVFALMMREITRICRETVGLEPQKHVGPELPVAV
jgi:pyrroloquinoline quinone (PQQ) biosynthesis protein C